MKILHICNYISIYDHVIFSRNISGYGLMVLDIANSQIADKNDIDLFTSSALTDEENIGGLKIVKHRFKEILLNTKALFLLKSIQQILKFKPSFFWLTRLFFYGLNLGYIEKLIKNSAYGIVHIHGITAATINIIDVCLALKQPFLITLHGLNSFDESIQVPAWEKVMEKEFLSRIVTEKLYVTVISSGLKKEIINYLGYTDLDNLKVISNGIDIKDYQNNEKIDIREKYNIPPSSLIFLCIGNISTHKNQTQLLEALLLLQNEDLKVLFLGNDNLGNFQELINSYNLSENAIFCGNIKKDYLSNYYEQGDYTIVVSKYEGFGLSIIEGFSFGLPCLIFNDLSAVNDLYDEKVMSLISDRATTSIAKSLLKMNDTVWDKSYIKKYSENFSLSKINQEYLNLYQEINSK